MENKKAKLEKEWKRALIAMGISWVIYIPVVVPIPFYSYLIVPALLLAPIVTGAWVHCLHLSSQLGLYTDE